MQEVTNINRALDLLNDTAAQWIGASQPRRRDLLRTLFDAVRIDIDAGEIVEWVLKPQFAALIRAAEAQ